MSHHTIRQPLELLADNVSYSWALSVMSFAVRLHPFSWECPFINLIFKFGQGSHVLLNIRRMSISMKYSATLPTTQLTSTPYSGAPPGNLETTLESDTLGPFSIVEEDRYPPGEFAMTAIPPRIKPP